MSVPSVSFAEAEFAVKGYSCHFRGLLNTGKSDSNGSCPVNLYKGNRASRAGRKLLSGRILDRVSYVGTPLD